MAPVKPALEEGAVAPPLDLPMHLIWVRDSGMGWDYDLVTCHFYQCLGFGGGIWGTALRVAGLGFARAPYLRRRARRRKLWR